MFAKEAREAIEEAVEARAIPNEGQGWNALILVGCMLLLSAFFALSVAKRVYGASPTDSDGGSDRIESCEQRTVR